MAYCQICQNRGLVTYLKVVNGVKQEYCARCNCKIGSKMSQRIPTIDQAGLALFAKKEGSF